MYLRNPRHRELWESDGSPPWMKYRADDGSIWDSAIEADRHDAARAIAAHNAKKKPYTPPHLRKYGNIRDMTETSATGMNTDAHGHRRSLHKTA